MCVLPGNSQSDECSSHSWKFSKFIKALDKHIKVSFLHFNLSSFLNKQSPWVHQSFQEMFPLNIVPSHLFFLSCSIQPGRRGSLVVHPAQGFGRRGDPRQGHRRNAQGR